MAISVDTMRRSNATMNSPQPPVDEVIKNLKTVRLERNDRLFEQNKDIESFYIVRQGLLGIFRHIDPDKRVLVHKIGRGESAGLAQLMDQSPYPGQLIPIKETVAYKGTGRTVENLCEESPADISRLLAVESRVHDNVLQKIDRIIGTDLESRIAHELLDLASRIGKRTEDGLKIIVKLTRKQISKMVGCTQESVIRVMSTWEKESWIKTQHKYITLLKPHTLQSI